MIRNAYRHPRVRAACTFLLLALLLAGSARTADAQRRGTDAERLRQIAAYVEKARQDWEVPGLGLAIVKNDSVIFAGGFGTRTLGRDAPVDEHTVFAIGSSSKAFTAAAIAMLIDEGRLSWDDRASEVYPGLEFHESYVTREIRLRDLLSHSSGLPRYDALWGTFRYPREEILRRVRYLEPGWSFRSAYGYQNIMFLAAGEIVRVKDGRSWDEFIAQRIFQPLGMTRSSTTIRALEHLENVATPHARVNDTLVAIPYRDIDVIGPAGSINSSVRDMAEWLRLQLGSGVHGDERLLSDSVMREMHTPQTLIRRSAMAERENPYSHFSTYGLAWFIEDHRGRKIVQHGGNIDGMSALVAMMPGENVGFVLLENLNGSGMRMHLMRYIFDRFLDAEEKDWSGEALERVRERRERAAARQDSAGGSAGPPRVPDTSPSRPLSHYAGTYESPMYGDLLITLEDGRLVARAGVDDALHVELEHWHFDTFRSRNLDPDAGALQANSRTMATFALDARGEPQAVTFGGLGEFRRRADRTADR